MDDAQETHEEGRASLPESGPPPALPPLPLRFVQVFVSPGVLFEKLKENPRWFGALALGTVLAIAAMAAIPADVWTEWFRLRMMESGQEMPEGMDFGGVQRVFAMVAGVLGYLLFSVILAGILTVIFGFVLGDEGRYKQYLAIVTHGGLIGTLGGVLVTPLRIIQRDPQATLNVGLFAPFLEDGYLLNLLTMLDFFTLWGTVVMALGVASLDKKRTWGSATAVLLVFTVGLMAIFAIFA
ncbi:MAG TPA: Yip1 family protein [Longimicrobiales bacterium]|jgi:hypothetical protein